MIEKEISAWRAYLRSHGELSDENVDELENHLREEIDTLRSKNLSEDEALIVAMRRIGRTSEIAREFSKTQGKILWKQFLIDPAHPSEKKRANLEILLVLALALAAGLLSRIPEFFGISLTGENTFFYLRNISFFIVPAIACYFFWRYPGRGAQGFLFCVVALAAAAAVNTYPLYTEGSFDLLIGIHVPIVIWLATGLVYVGGNWRNADRKMDFVRFSGETFIYLVLIYCGGGVLLLSAGFLFSAIGIEIERVLFEYVAVIGLCSAPVVAAYLAGAKRNIIENMAPVLARIFSPLFLVLLLAFIFVLGASAEPLDFKRDVLIGFDLLLAVVLGILLYIISARDDRRGPGPLDFVNVGLIIAALLVDTVGLVAILSRISTYGFSPNKIAALGENIVLFVNLGVSAVLYIRFIIKKDGFRALLVWQTGYLAVIGAWAGCVAFLFPLIFRQGY